MLMSTVAPAAIVTLSLAVGTTPPTQVDGEFQLPPVAVGKDWFGVGFATGPAPSKTGYSFSIAGVLGGTLAVEEGIEFHLLGSTIGIDPNDLAIKLPALGKLSLLGNQ